MPDNIKQAEFHIFIRSCSMKIFCKFTIINIKTLPRTSFDVIKSEFQIMYPYGIYMNEMLVLYLTLIN